MTAKEVSLAIAAAPFGGCASANGRSVGSGRRLKCGRWTAVQLVCLERVVCRKSRVRARVKSGLLRSTSPTRCRWPSLFELALVEVTQVNAIVALDFPATATIATLESKQSHSVLHLPYVVDVGCRGISGKACRYVTQRRRAAWVFCSHARVIETGIRPCGRLLPVLGQ